MLKELVNEIIELLKESEAKDVRKTDLENTKAEEKDTHTE